MLRGKNIQDVKRMNVNGTFFKLYLMDTVETIKERIAVKFFPGVAYRFIKFIPSDFTTRAEASVEVKNLLGPFLNQKGDFPQDLFNETLGDVKREDVEKIFVLYHQDVMRDYYMAAGADFAAVVLNQIGNLKYVDVFKLWKNKSSEMEKLTKEHDKTINKITMFEKQAKEFERIKTTEISNFDQTRVDINFSYDVPQITLSQIFNKIKVSKNVPFVAMGRCETQCDEENNESEEPKIFYKLLNKFTPYPEWLELQLNTVILLKVNHEFETYSRIEKNYSNTSITVNKNRVYLTINIPVGTKAISKDMFMQRVITAVELLKDVKPEKEEETFITGYFYIQFSCNSFIWSDLCMTNKFFYPILVLNEVLIPSRQRILFMYMLISKRARNDGKNYTRNTPLSEDLYDTINLISKKLSIDQTPPPGIKTNCFTRFRVKCRTKQDVERYKNILARLFTLYVNNRDLLENQYISFLPNFPKSRECDLVQTESKLLKDIVPDLFIASYSRKCLKPPNIISNSEALQLQKEGKQIMKYPLYGEGPTHNYYCDIKNYTYPGLRINTLRNNDVYPYIPCCYLLDQRKRKNSKLNLYESKSVFPQYEAVENNIKLLPPQLKRFFSLISRDIDSCFVYLDVAEYNLSLIESVLNALDLLDAKNSDIYDSDIEEIPNLVLREHERIKAKNLWATKQEMYDLSIDEIKDVLFKDILKPSKFVHLMEEVYKIDIFLFSFKNEGEMIIPQHASIYRKFKPTRKTILLLETEQGFSKLIFQTTLSFPPKTQSVFQPNSSLVENLWTTYLRLSRSFVLNEEISPPLLPEKIDITNQWIDYFGKCRIILLSNGMLIMTDPIPPFNVPIIQKISRFSNQQQFSSFLNTRKLTPTKQAVVKNRAVEITVFMGDVKLLFLTDLEPLQNVPVENKQEFFHLFTKDKTAENKKIAHVMSQYALFIFSEYMARNAPKNNTDENLEMFSKFVQDMFSIQPKHTWSVTSSRFMSRSTFIQNNKIIVTSEEMKKRLMYVIYHLWITQRQKLVNYKNLVNIPDYFKDISDFEPINNGIIIEGTNISNMLKPIMNNMVTTSIQLNTNRPYFFFNDVFKNVMFLAVNSPDFDIAINIVKAWNAFGFNDVSKYDEPVDDEDDVYVYSYVNENDIKLIHDVFEAIPGCVMGYIYNGEKRYTSLLPI